MIGLLLVVQLNAAAAPPPSAPSSSAALSQGTETQGPSGSTEVVRGEGRPTVTIPRIDASVEIDGRLDEPVWSQAARLGGFWQQQPADGRPAEEQTEVRVWYSPDAIHFGVIAGDSQPDTIRATMADRDNLDRDDTVTIFLDTFNDRRRAFFFTVNPLGIQQDGVQTEGAGSAGHFMGFGEGDRNPDYQFDSRGRVTDSGFVVEIRIPFKSLRYPGNGPQTWGLNIQRKVQRTGYQDTWTDVRRASSSFLGQSGAIDGIHDLKRGVVKELQPFLAVAANGSRGDTGAFTRGKADYTPGVNLRFGFTNTSLDATVNPDFSQVESDAGQVTANERFALFYAEKRPFFLEGNELFATPNQLVYTRQIVQPIAGGKFTGKMGQTTFAYLIARDRADDGDATFNVVRIRQDVGEGSLAGVTVTDRTTAAGFNRVAAGDLRVTFAKIYYVQAQAGRSWTDRGGVTETSPMWNVVLDCTGRAWGCQYSLLGIGSDFESQSGFVPRHDYVQFRASNRLTWYGARGAVIEDFSVNYYGGRFWPYVDFTKSAPIEGTDSLRASAKLRGGWEIEGSLGHSFYRFDPDDYSGYGVEEPDGTVAPYVPPGRSAGFSQSVQITTPVYRRLNGSFEASTGSAAIFAEAADGLQRSISASLSLRPTESIRADLTLTVSRLRRARDASEFATTVIPRVKVEYQPTRALFVRVVTEYRSERQAMLVDAWAGRPLLVNGVPTSAESLRGLRIDALFSYEPTPGTVAFFGYGTSLGTSQDPFTRDLSRMTDGFFMKLAYQFRR